MNRTLRLRDEIQSHADTARDQLNVFAEQHKDFKPILAGVAISQHGIECNNRAFEWRDTLSTEDDEERVLRSAELLKIPNLELTEEWVPTEEALDNLGSIWFNILPYQNQTEHGRKRSKTRHKFTITGPQNIFLV